MTEMFYGSIYKLTDEGKIDKNTDDGTSRTNSETLDSSITPIAEL